ncbi:MAG: tetratricopeptide repeat protein [Rhizorhabdus sp.]
MASTPPTEEAFLREVDDELRREQIQTIWSRYGRLALILVALLLAAFAAFLFWRDQATKKAEAHSEQMSAAIADIQAGRKTEASKKIETLIAEGGTGYNATARFTKAALALQNGDAKAAAALYAGLAADEKVAEPFRELALIRQTMIEYDSLEPQRVIDRMKPLAVEGGAYFGTAAELTAIALIQVNRGAEAGRLLAAVASDKNSPASLRARARQLASSLGADVAADKD